MSFRKHFLFKLIWVAFLVAGCCMGYWAYAHQFATASSVSLSSTPESLGSASAMESGVGDTVRKIKYSVNKTVVTQEDDLDKKPVDLKEPENLESNVFYDEATGSYRMGTKLNNQYLAAPFYMTQQEYSNWSFKRSMSAYFREKNNADFKAKGKDKFDFTNMNFSLGPAEKIFGPGGVKIQTQGSAELKLGATTRKIDNPSLSERNRKTFGFDFDENVNLNVKGSVGDKVNVDFNYNTEATFDFDAQNLKLRYEGKEDEIIKLIEAGNVSMPTNSSLIRGASSLFGVRADMQFGKLKLQTVVSQKKSSTQSVSSEGGVQLTNYEFSADNYEENRHFFLSEYFRSQYNKNMSQLPNVLSGITINRIEVWVTNKTGATTNTRNIVAFTDLGERTVGSSWDGSINPQNSLGGLYSTLTTSLVAARDISQTTQVLDGAGFSGGNDYEKLENARLLSSSEYSLNTSLGYLSLNTTLQPDQVLAVAFEYTYRGGTYQVGEFSTDQKDNSNALFVKALKNTSNSPRMRNWRLMMKNVYSLGATSVQKENFKLDIKLLSDSSGVYISYLPEPGLKDKKLIQLMGMDRLDNNNKNNPNGYFDYIDGYTINSSNGRVYFPTVEPFGSDLASAINNEAIAQRYVFQELYDSTKTVAKQIADKNKFLITGQYKASSGSEISLGSTNVPRGSVVVTAGGQTLVENVDYTVDYNFGVVTILNQSIIDAGTPVSVSSESDSEYGMQRKTMVGLNFEYDFTKNFQIGGTLMHLGEQPLTTKVAMGSEPLNNTIWGLNMSWKQQSQWLTDIIDKLPFLHCTAPSSINFTAEVAQLIAGKNKGSQGNASYLDDFENTKTTIDVSVPTEWVLSSCPSDFPESKYSNDIRYGYNRAKLAWYNIDPLFTRRSSSLTPSHIKSDLEQLSDPYVREVYKRELFPNTNLNYNESSAMTVLNLAYYPNERGPYNLDPNLDADGHLSNPRSRWGGMMRRIDNSDFETSNIEYIEFWLMDPFIKSEQTGLDQSGDFYIDLGEISEDVLKDGKKYSESAMPINAESTEFIETVWGRVPTQSSVTYAFNTSGGSRQQQDVGLNGLSSEQEQTFSTYLNYLQQVKTRVRPAVYDSIFANPSGDKYHYFRGSDFDEHEVSILNRYKDINNPNGNSVDSDHSPEKYSTAYKTTPDVEDINQDYTLNEYEKYYQYHVRLAPEAMVVGQNYIVDKRTVMVTLRNNEKQEVSWYQFRIPLDQYEKREGEISDFTSIRFMRMFLTNFSNPVVLRFATLNLVRGDWRSYDQNLYTGEAPSVSGTLSVSAVSYEENNEKTPVNYILPPGISRVQDPSQGQVLEENEQALSLVVNNLASGDARAVYKNTNLDLRRYKHLQMFVHANALSGDDQLADDQTSVFIRMGSDYNSNFYEYEVPLKLTPEGRYADGAGAIKVWPEENMIDVDLSVFTDLKKARNRQKSLGLITNSDLYSDYQQSKPNNRISIMGNPSLGEVRTIMIGVRNRSRATQSVEVWANELRLQDYTTDGGWAAQATLNLQLSDFATLNLSGHLETAGFGGLEEGVMQRRQDDLYQYQVSTNVELGRFLPDKAKFKVPFYYSYSKEKKVPKYNPLDTDMLMSDAMDALTTQHERDSLSAIVNSVVVNKNLSISNARIDWSTKGRPMPYDPANFSFTYSKSHKYTTGETTAWERNDTWKWGLTYDYSPVYKPFEPFKKKIKSKSKWLSYPKDFSFNYLPQSVSFGSDINRNYYEFQERDMEDLSNNSLPLTWTSDFFWNRNFSIRWDLTKNLHANFSSQTNAEIEQPYTPVNKDLYPDEYSAWKDSVWHSIRHFGAPLTYQQNFDASWSLPLDKIPALSWISADVSYSSNYNWARGTEMEDGTSLGNTITTSRDASFKTRLSMEKLYNFVPFLKSANRRFATSAGGGVQKKEKANFSKEITLKPDTTLTVKHSQKSKKLKVTAIRTDGTRYPLRYKIVDKENILILSKDTARIKLTVAARKSFDESKFYDVLQGGARFLMMVRSVSASYRNSYSMTLPGFMPTIGDFFGQGRRDGVMRPGLDFAFGFVDEGYIQKAIDRNWLLCSDSIITPATTNMTEDLQLRATLEPIRSLKIDLTATRNVNKVRSIQYMYEGMPTTETGSFQMTTISIGSAFESMGNINNGYASKRFTRFLSNLDKYQQQIERLYVGQTYPEGNSLAGQEFNPENGTVSRYSSEVMIPAFIEAYTGQSSSGIFPALSRLLPNWSVSYDGLSRLSFFKRWFKNFTLNHSYKSIYSVGSYSTYNSFMEMFGAYGFVNDVTSGNPVPSCMYDISTVSINESFSPLLGVSMTFQNNITAKAEYRRTRVLNLSMTSLQIVDTRSYDWVFGFGYKITNFKLFSPKKKVRKVSSRNKSNKSSDTGNQSASAGGGGFSSDLNIRFDLSIRNQAALNRDIMTAMSTATSGNKAVQVSFSADYAVSRMLTISAYYDRQMNRPLLTSSSYPTTTQDFGISLKFQLTR